jgi:glycosyltransferase involved in cell wall biosynthesis
MQNRKKVVHVVEAFGGGIIEFVRLLTNLTVDNYEHTIIHGSRVNDIEKIKILFNPNIKFYLWVNAQREISIIQDFKALKSLFKVLKSIEFDVLHLHSTKAGILGRIIGFFFRKKTIIYTPHSASFVRNDISWKTKKMYHLIEYLANKLSGKVIAVSKSEAEEHQKIGINAGWINNGVVIEDAEPNIQKYLFPKIQIVTSGRIETQKNPFLFNEIAEAFEDREDVEFLWIGEGDMRQVLTSENISVTGWIQSTEVRQKLKESHIYLSTALWEGLPFAVIEAMQESMPLILSNCVGNVDLVKEGVNGYLFENKEKAITLINNYINDRPNSMITHGHESRKIAEDEFSVEKMIQSYRKIYDNF